MWCDEWEGYLRLSLQKYGVHYKPTTVLRTTGGGGGESSRQPQRERGMAKESINQREELC